LLFNRLFYLFAGFLILLSACNNDRNNMHERMGRNGQMGSGGMMNGREFMNDSSAEGRRGMSIQNQRPAEKTSISEELTIDQARLLAAKYLKKTGNTSLVIGNGSEQGDIFEFPLLQKDNNQKAASLVVDKHTGIVHSEQ
jgi:hypothetical protein